MSYGSISVNTKTFNERAEGNYYLSTLALGDPQDHIRLRGGAIRGDGKLSFGITRRKEADVTVNGDTTRVDAVINVNVILPKDGSVTASTLDDMFTDIAEFVTSATVTEMVQGKS